MPNQSDTANAKYNVTPIAWGVVLAMLSFAGTSHAQSAPSPAPGVTQLEEVVITANKRTENLETVPQAISVLGEETLERNNVREVADVVNLSPALTITYGSTPANNGINMRGIGTTSIGIGVESDVAVIVDDVPIGMQVKAFSDLSDVARIEVLKGPQSTLFGKSAIAGAVNIVTKPIKGPMAGAASTYYTSDHEYRLGGSYGGEVNEKFGFRVAVSDNNFPGNVNNLTTGGKVNGDEGKTLAAKLSFHPTDDLDIDLMPRWNHSKSNCCVLVLTSFNPPPGTAPGGLLSNIAQLPASSLLSGINVGPNNRDIRNDAFTGQQSTDRGVGLKITHPLPGGLTFTSITSWDHYTAQDSRDQDFVDVSTLLFYPLANGQPAGVNAGYTQYGDFDVASRTQELRVTSPDSGSVKYVVGLWYAKNDINRHFIRGYNGIALTTPVQYFTETTNENKAIYGQASWEFIPDYTIVGGLRYNREVSGYTFSVGAPPPGAFVQTAYYQSLNNGEDAVTGKLSLQHQFTPSLMGYVLGSTGYKGLAYDLTSGLTAATAAQQPVKSETARSVEAGLKGDFFDHRLQINADAFYTKFYGYQQNAGDYLPGTTTFVTRLSSIGGVQTRGFEMDAAALLVPGLELTGSFAYTDATITKFPDGPCYNVAGSPNGGFNAQCQINNPIFGGNVTDLAGARMPNAPRVKANVGAQYDIPLKDYPFDLFVNGNVRYQSYVLTNITQDPAQAVPAFSITNIGFGIRDKADRATLSFFVNNLFDKHYANTGFTGAGSWSTKAPNPVVSVTNTTWTPARDAFRYFGVRLDVKF